jgi:RNA polymerase sigma factor (sigma-70 family)
MTAKVHRRGLHAALESEPAPDVLYLRYRDFVRRALRRHYVDPSEVDDVTQQVFLVLLQRVDEATEKRSIGSWLYQIVRRVAANHHRGRRRLVRKHGELAVRDALSGAGDPEEAYAREQAWGFVRDFLESLDEEACAVFVMSEIEGLRGAEIAARLRLTLPMTYARIRSVRARFDRAIARSRPRAFLWLALARATPSVALATSWRLAAGLVLALLALVLLLVTRGGGGDDPATPGPSADHATKRGDHDDHREASRVSSLDSDENHDEPPAEVFGGVVVDLDGTPIPDAIVCAGREEDPAHRLNDPPACVTSDRDGRFRVGVALAQAHTLEAMARGFVPGRFRGRATHGIRIVLHPGGVELSGVVSDVHGGPVEDAWVSVENRADFTLGATVRTDERGAFSMWVVEGPISLAAGADSYAATFSPALAPANDVRIELGAESVLAGIVVDAESGEPMAGIRVSALLGPPSERYANRGRVAFSDAAGRWEIRGLQPNQYVMDAAGERSWGRALELIELGIGERQEEIRIEMLAGVEIVGRVIDADTRDACVDGTAWTLDATQSIDRSAIVQRDGLVTVAPLTGGAVYEVTATCRGYASGKFEVDLRDGPLEVQEWALRRGSELVVRVVDSAGAPLSDWNVEVSEHGTSTTGPDGSVVVAGMKARSYRVTASGPGHPPIVVENVDVGTERSFVELRAAQGVAIAGTVVSTEGRPVAGALVALQRPKAAGAVARVNDPARMELSSDDGPYHAVTNAAGEFRHASVAAGVYGVWVVPADAAIAVQSPGMVPPGFAARVMGRPLRTIRVSDRELELELELGGLRSIAGVVRDEDGDSVVDARLFAVRMQDGGDLDTRGRPRMTDAHGRYTIEDLPAGTYSVFAFRHGPGVARRTGVEAGERAADLVFPTVGRISGRVRAADGSAVHGYILSVGFDEDSPNVDRQSIPVGSKEGRFIATGLEAGRYALEVMAPDGEGEAIVELAAGEHRTGIEITLEPRARIEARLVDAESKPLAGWIVALRDPDDPLAFANITVTGDDGRFVLGRLIPRAWALVALPGSPSLLEPPFDFEDPAWQGPALMVVTPRAGETIALGDLVVSPE